MPLSYGQPTPGAGAWAVSTWPVRGSPVGFSGRHVAAIMNSVFPSGPPSMHAKPQSAIISLM
jgi:hypothetical protein